MYLVRRVLSMYRQVYAHAKRGMFDTSSEDKDGDCQAVSVNQQGGLAWGVLEMAGILVLFGMLFLITRSFLSGFYFLEQSCYNLIVAASAYCREIAFWSSLVPATELRYVLENAVLTEVFKEAMCKATNHRVTATNMSRIEFDIKRARLSILEAVEDCIHKGFKAVFSVPHKGQAQRHVPGSPRPLRRTASFHPGHDDDSQHHPREEMASDKQGFVHSFRSPEASETFSKLVAIFPVSDSSASAEALTLVLELRSTAAIFIRHGGVEVDELEQTVTVSFVVVGGISVNAVLDLVGLDFLRDTHHVHHSENSDATTGNTLLPRSTRTEITVDEVWASKALNELQQEGWTLNEESIELSKAEWDCSSALEEDWDGMGSGREVGIRLGNGPKHALEELFFSLAWREYKKSDAVEIHEDTASKDEVQHAPELGNATTHNRKYHQKHESQIWAKDQKLLVKRDEFVNCVMKNAGRRRGDKAVSHADADSIWRVFRKYHRRMDEDTLWQRINQVGGLVSLSAVNQRLNQDRFAERMLNLLVKDVLFSEDEITR